MTLSVSIGTATIDTSNESPGTDITWELIGRADAARLDSKSLGRNRVRTYRPDLRDHSAAMLSMRHEFSAALNAGTLELHYQQIRSCPTTGSWVSRAS